MPARLAAIMILSLAGIFAGSLIMAPQHGDQTEPQRPSQAQLMASCRASKDCKAAMGKLNAHSRLGRMAAEEAAR